MALACAPELPETPSGRTALHTQIEPLSRGPSIAPRIVVTDYGAQPPDLSQLAIFHGDLNKTQIDRLKRWDVASLAAAREPFVAWFEAGRSKLSIVPSLFLQAGQIYTLAAAEWGVLARFVPEAGDQPQIHRLWPPARTPQHSSQVVYCGAEAALIRLLPNGTIQFDPTHALRNLRGEVCFEGQAELPNDGLPRVPLNDAGALWDPAPLLLGAAAGATAVACVDGELAIARGCAQLLDDRWLLRTPAAPTLWRFASGLVLATQAQEIAVLRLEPGQVQAALVGEMFDLAGERLAFEVSAVCPAPQTHLVINEVLTDPWGREPDQEWLELVNDGVTPLHLQDFILDDNEGSTPLPDLEIAPGQYVVLVPEAFSETSTLDVALAPNTSVARVKSLGVGGLGNNGESLRLRAKTGNWMSQFAVGKAHAGQSFARLSSDTPDHAPVVFGYHAAPGASPGAPNQLAAER